MHSVDSETRFDRYHCLVYAPLLTLIYCLAYARGTEVAELFVPLVLSQQQRNTSTFKLLLKFGVYCNASKI